MTVGEETAKFKANHLPWVDSDFYGLQLVLAGWSEKGFEDELDSQGAPSGYVRITTDDWTRSDGCFAMMELHKRKGRKLFLWQTTRWAARLFRCQSLQGAFPEMHGCIGAPTLILAMQRAVDAVGRGMPSGNELTHYYQT